MTDRETIPGAPSAEDYHCCAMPAQLIGRFNGIVFIVGSPSEAMEEMYVCYSIGWEMVEFRELQKADEAFCYVYDPRLPDRRLDARFRLRDLDRIDQSETMSLNERVALCFSEPRYLPPSLRVWHSGRFFNQ